MMSPELYTLLGLIAVNGIGLFKSVFLVSKKDKQQDSRLQHLESNTKKIDYVFKKAKENEYREQLKTEIRKSANKIIFANALTNNDFISFVSRTRNYFIEFIDSILVQDINEIFIESLERDMITFAKSLKESTDFAKISNDPEIYEKIKREVKTHMDIFIIRFNDEIISEKKEFNGAFSKIVLGTISTLTINVIKIYRDSNK